MPPKKPQPSAGGSHRSPAAGIAAQDVNRCGSSWHWTNERHVRYLNYMEASFVEAMFGDGNGAAAPPPLDRYLPDTAESTEDLVKHKRTRQNAASASGLNGIRTDNKTRILSSQKSSQDQVVPQIHITRDDEDDDSPFGQPIRK